MSVEEISAEKSETILCICVSCERARIGTELWGEYNIETLLNPDLQIAYGLCPQCESRLQHSLGLMSRLQAF